MAPLVVLIDGHSLAYRAYYALLRQGLQTRKGEPTHAVYGFTSMLLKVWREHRPDYMAVAFDVGRTFRHETFTEYKATRAERPSDFDVQLARIHQIIDAFAIPKLTAEGYEADDVIGTAALQALRRGMEILIVTGDTDTFQLIRPGIRVLTSRRHFDDIVIYDVEAIRERYGLEPHQLVDLKALTGDPSDNIPGVRGIGERTATELLKRYGSLENIYEHLHEIQPERIRRLLEAGRESAFLSKQLVQIRTDVPLTVDWEACRVGRYHREAVLDLFRELEFRSLMNRLPDGTTPLESTQAVEEEAPRLASQPTLFPEPVGPAVIQPLTVPPLRAEHLPRPTEAMVVTDEAGLAALREALERAPRFALDVETDALAPMSAALVGLSFAVEEGRGYYVPVGHRDGSPQLPLPHVLEALRPILSDPRRPKVGHHAKFDLLVLARYGVEVEGLAFDTMVAEWVLNPAAYGLSLKHLAWLRLGVEMTTIEQLIGKGKGQRSFADVPISAAAPYAAADADLTLRIARVQEEELRRQGLWDLFTEIEIPLIPVLMRMELAGILIDVPLLQQMSKELERRIQILAQEIYRWVGYAFNLDSPRQLSDALFGKLQLPTVDVPRTGTGMYSTSSEVLEGLRGAHPVIDLILEYRQLAKLKSTYVDALPRLIHPATGRIHPIYHQTGTVTGRISASDPNIQNIPTRTELGKQIRRAFIAPPGFVLLSADYSQIELRILAHITKDPGLIAAFQAGEDIHRATAAKAFGIPLDRVTDEQRNFAKRINYGLIYGMSAHGLAQQLGISRREADRFIQQYFAAFPQVKAYIEAIKEQAARQGYVETLLGRRRYFPELMPAGPGQTPRRLPEAVRRKAEREAINAPIQGSAADLIKRAMIRIDRALRERGLHARMIMQVHDELVFEVFEEEVEEVRALVEERMRNAYPLAVPLEVEIHVGPCWS
ncbi:MAG: DNA polymerase I [Anaerolineae bacterium]|uniref:DNA polymerase I n=1 Tax=Thermoflexus sp. TaxID=1969742 RepID=UPI0025E6D30D|nr:DNA polymerase I [Thermoflexus sp.]MCS7350882.1 DNA polymerase I [Thermoflexus sp.]MDW8180333.1 DNA polymerase I [Anaerolineae bacterium]